MTFRELLEKYRAGQASEEERALVEKELEKSEAIADYLAERVEDELGAAEAQTPAGEIRHIQKKVNRRLRRTAVWAACIVLAVLLGVRFVVSPLVDAMYYRPNAHMVGLKDWEELEMPEGESIQVVRRDELSVSEAEKGGRRPCQDVAVDLTALYSLLVPGETVTDAYAEPEGFGRYTLTVETKAWLTGAESQRTGPLRAEYRERWVKDGNQGILEVMDHVDRGSNGNLEVSSYTPDYLAELPSTSYVAAWVHFPEALNTVQLYQLEEKKGYHSVCFLWAGVAGQGGEDWSGRIGFPLLDAVGNGGISPSWVDYPMFSWEQLVAERAVGVAYEQRFRSLLAYVNDRPEAMEVLLGGESWAGYYQSCFAEAADYVEANGVRVTGALVYAEAGDLLRLWENGDVDKIAIDTVLPSRYSADGEFGW